MLHLHRAERADRLVQALGEVLRRPLADPFTAEVVAVPAKGVERWLHQRLSAVLGASAADGVSANVRFPSPARLVAEVLTASRGADPDEDPWAPARLLWTLLGVLDGCLGESWCGVLSSHLGRDADDTRRSRRWATADLLTRLFTAYAAERPAMLVDWAAGRDTDGTGAALPDDLSWQAVLWRRLREQIGEPSPAERLAGACERLRADPGVVDLPERLSLFGPTRLTTEQVTVLGALASGRVVHLWLPHPSPALWDRLTGCAPAGRRSADTTSLAARHPLLASLARDTRELQGRLQPVAATDTHHTDGARPPSLLGALQAAVRDDLVPAGRVPLDATVQVHACHGPGRQVEVLREALLHLFEQDPTLEPRDVLVMCPDVETYAPLVRAGFGQGPAAGHDAHPGHRLRVRLADRSLRQTNPLLDTVAGLLTLADARVTASQLLDLAASAPVRRRFGLDADDLEQVRVWAVRAGVRWGIGRRQREAHGLGDLPQNTWTTGLDRLLLGVAADESDLSWLDTALPLDDVDGTDVDLAGRLAELVDRLAAALGRLQGPQTAPEWTAALSRALDLLTDVAEADAWQLAEARRELSAATEHAGSAVLRLADVRAMLASRLAGRPTRANFRTGELTVCTMVPMRSVPHRVVALLGLDDDVFPRSAGVDGDDVLARDPCVGERDRRSEDRQLLLDAVLSAGERLLVLYTGADPVSGSPRPPAVPLGELLDVVADTAGVGVADVVRRHPLQPFDPRNFAAADPFSFDPAAFRGARAGVAARVPEPGRMSGPLPARPLGHVELADLVAFAVHPAQAFLRQRLGVRVPEEDDQPADALDTDLDPLSAWGVGERMLTARLRGVGAVEFRQAEWRRGTLPPARLGVALLTDLEAAVDVLAQACLPVHAGEPATVDVVCDLGGGRRLTGTVTGVHGQVLASSSYSRLAAKHRMAAWVRLLAVAAGGPAGEWRAVTTGRGGYRRPSWRSTLLAPPDPLEQLRRLVDLRERGLRAPLPVATGASAVYADRRASGGTVAEALDAARAEWDSTFGDGTDRHLAWLHGRSPRLDVLLGEPPADDERSWSQDPTRFGVLAQRLWAPLLGAETQGQP
ncbi:MAG: Exodeoxyribonuclease gamma chain [Frankiales bacterium]|nr:Exodeoxyribonuclease gamma chain [Frankiales bacterium]